MRNSASVYLPIGLLSLALGSGVAIGQATESQSASEAPSAPLAGPRVAEGPRTAGIVRRDFDGNVVLPEFSPEEAAFEALNLGGEYATPEQQAGAAKAREILATRRRLLDEFVIDHLQLLTELATAKGTGNRLDQLALFQKAFTALAPLREKGTLQQQIHAALPEADAKVFDQFLAAFWKAVEDNRGTMTTDEGTTPGRFGARAQVNLKSLGNEIRASYERVKESGELVYRRLTEGLRLTPKQQGALREVAANLAKAADEGASKGDHRKFFFAALRQLDEEQRPKFIRNVKQLANM